jgi:putative membrane protein
MGMTQATLLANIGDGDHGWWPLWPLLWIAVIGTIAWFVTRRRRNGERPRDGVDRARDILAERYARGEIATDEYRERLEQLR